MLLRGGIEKGKYFVNENTIFGPAVIKAYRLENKKAIYPRIIISHDIVKGLKDHGFQKKRTYIKLPNEHDDLVNQLKLLCIKDIDDYYFVHYFNCVQNIALLKNTSRKDKIESFIKDSILAYKDTDLYQKYEWLANYYEKYMKENYLAGLKNMLFSPLTEENKNRQN